MTKEEIWEKWDDKADKEGFAINGKYWNLQAMQEYAEEYHREKLREELLKFAEWMEGDMRPEYIIQWVDKYLSLQIIE